MGIKEGGGTGESLHPQLQVLGSRREGLWAQLQGPRWWAGPMATCPVSVCVFSESAGVPVALVPPPPFSFRTYNLIHPIYLLLISPELLRPALSTCAEAQPSRNCSFLCSSAASCRMHTHPQGPRPALSLWHVHSTCAWGNRGKGRGTCSM